MLTRRSPSRPLVSLLFVLVAVLALTSACANSTTRARPAASTATPSPTATSTLPTSSQVTAYIGAGDHVYALDGHSGAVKWTYVTGHGTAFGGIDGVAVMAGMVFAHGTGATPDGQPTRGLYALDATTGALRWTLQPPAPQVGGPNALGDAEPVAVVGGVVYLFAPGGQVPSGAYAVDLATGTVLWGAATPGAIAASVDSKTVYVTQVLGGSSAQAPTDETLTALDRTTGAQRWQVHGLGEVAVAASGDLLYATSFGSPTTLSALDAVTGTARWTAPTDGNTGVHVAGATLYVGDQSGVSALDAATGQEHWRFPVAGGTGVEDAGATLCLSYRDQSSYHLVGVDAATGAQRWALEAAVPSSGYGGGSGSGGGACYARVDQLDAAGSVLRRVDAATGTTSWTVDAGGQVVGRLYIFADAIYSETSVGRQSGVKVLSVADGSTLWQFTPDGDFGGTLAVG